MPSRRPSRNAVGLRCGRCRMRTELCVCAEIPRLDTKVRLTLLVHSRELYSTTNTGKLASYAFPDSRVLVRGREDEEIAASDAIGEGRQGLVLYPGDDAQELTPEFVRSLKKPVTLVVPDGTWRQAAKAARREPALADAVLVKLPPGPPTEYGLRLAPTQTHLSTIEAIARAMGVLEGPEARAQLEKLFRLVVARTLWSRGALPLDKCRELIPPAAVEAARLRSTHKKNGA